MTTALVTAFMTAGPVLAYLAVALMAARFVYARVRPYAEPLSCKGHYDCHYNGRHALDCYRQRGCTLSWEYWYWEYWYHDTTSGAVTYGVAVGLFWPISIVAAGLWWVVSRICLLLRIAVTGNTPERPLETAARWKREKAAMKARIAELEQQMEIGERP